MRTLLKIVAVGLASLGAGSAIADPIGSAWDQNSRGIVKRVDPIHCPPTAISCPKPYLNKQLPNQGIDRIGPESDRRHLDGDRDRTNQRDRSRGYH